MADGKIVVTLKAGTGYDAPWLVIGGDTTAEVHTVLEEAHAQDLFTAVGRAADALKRGVALGAGLGARTIEVKGNPDPAEVVAAVSKARLKADTLTESKPVPKVAPPAGAPRPAWVK